MGPEMRRLIKQLLAKHKDVFSCIHEDMLGANNDIIEHCLCVNPEAKKVHQKCRSFSTKKYVAIADVDHLLAMGFIR